MSGFIIEAHALRRYRERGGNGDLASEVAQGLPFGAQKNGDRLLVLSSGLVAAVSADNYVRTVLTKRQAIANMQMMGIVARPVVDPVPQSDESQRDYVADLAATHVIDEVLEQQRNNELRLAGIDQDSGLGIIYRAAYRAASLVRGAREDRIVQRHRKEKEKAAAIIEESHRLAFESVAVK